MNDDGHTIIKLTKVSRQYGGAWPAITDVDFQVSKG